MVITLRKFIKIITTFIASILLIILCLYIAAYFSGDPQSIYNRYIKLYDDHEDIYYQSINDYTGNYVKLDEISSNFTNSIISIEDKRFYQHHGFDYIGITRAITSNITSSSTQGASTISQQYARLLYLTNEKTYSRKIKEAFLTMQLESHLTKEEILEGYCNSVYFGHGIYGIENAAHYYYDKSAKDLDLNEASMLAGVVNGPNYYSPLLHPKKARQRQLLVLQSMVNNNLLNKDEIVDIQNQTLNLAKDHTITKNNSLYYYKDTVYDELEDLGFLKDKYINKGLNVYTTFNQDYQNQLNKQINELKLDDMQCSLVVSDPSSSKVLALIGGNDYDKSQYNRATKVKRQIGSTMKPFLYYLALENGFNVTSKFLSEPTTFALEDGSHYTVKNYGNHYAYQDITLAQALAVSDNIFAVKTHLFLGTKSLRDLIELYDFEDIDDNASLALGTLETNTYKLANMYNSIANLGKYQENYTINKITDNDGNVLYEHEDKQKQLLNKDSCLVLIKAMTGTFNPVFNTYSNATMSSYHPDYEVACKTGSTDNDNLCVAFTKNILITSWVGYDDNQEITDSSKKGYCKEITMSFLDYVNSKESLEWYKPSSNIQEIKINPLTGENDENGTIYWFKKT